LPNSTPSAASTALPSKQADKAQVYSRLGMTLTYHPNEKRVADPSEPGA
jgi:hypothetical protein